eukprot:COSAG02_NODE_72_length_41961_cov_13.243658_3_plen_430_part_00
MAKQAATMRGATELEFFTHSARFRRGHFEPAGMWWMICCLKLKQKLETLAAQRTIVEVLMFHYMGITTIAFSLLVCRDVASGGVTRSLSIVDLAVSCETMEYQLLWTCAFLVFVFYSLGFPLLLMLVSKPELLRRVRTTLGLRRAGSSAPGLQARAVLPMRSPKFDMWCRVSNIFTSENRGWMALLLWRRAVLVLVFGVSQSSNGQLYLPSGLGVDSRLLCFVLLVVYTVVQAHQRPYLLPSDNALEVCILIALMFMMFADIALDRVFCEDCFGVNELKLKTIVVAFTVLLVAFLVAMHKKLNAKRGALAKVGLVDTQSAGSGSGALASTLSAETGLTETVLSGDGPEIDLRAVSEDIDLDVSEENMMEQSDVAAICTEFGLEMHVVKLYRKAFKVCLSHCVCAYVRVLCTSASHRVPLPVCGCGPAGF